jgi:hypothetical protein
MKFKRRPVEYPEPSGVHNIIRGHVKENVMSAQRSSHEMSPNEAADLARGLRGVLDDYFDYSAHIDGMISEQAELVMRLRSWVDDVRKAIQDGTLTSDAAEDAENIDSLCRTVEDCLEEAECEVESSGNVAQAAESALDELKHSTADLISALEANDETDGETDAEADSGADDEA